MNRKKAVEILTELSRAGIINPKKDSIILTPQNLEGIKSRDEKLQINTSLHFGSRIWLQAVMDEHQLKFKEQPNKLVIY